MRIPLCILTLAVCAYAADTPEQAPAQSPPAAATDSKQPDPNAPPPAPPAKYGGWVFSGLADGYATYNSDHPPSGLNTLANFDLHAASPRLSLVKATIDKSDKVLGVHLDVGAGETMRLIHSTDPAAIDHQALRYVEQMYLILKPNKTNGMEVDFGQFVTSAGAEVIESSSNWNYTRSLLFAYAIPYYHFGVKLTQPITKELTVGFQVTNAWNTVWGNNNFKNIAATLALTKTKYTYSLNYLEGPNHLGTSAGKRNLIDTTLLLTPNSKLNMYVNADYGRDNNIGGGYNQWYGGAAAARFQITKIIAAAGRLEFFNDPSGFTTGAKQVLKEGTATGEAKITDHFVARAEFRHDGSNTNYFQARNNAPGVKTQNTFTVGLVALLGPLK